MRQKLTEDDSDEILMALRQGHIAYVINTIDINHGDSHSDGSEIRRAAVENNVTMFTSLDTVKGAAGCAGGDHSGRVHH